MVGPGGEQQGKNRCSLRRATETGPSRRRKCTLTSGTFNAEHAGYRMALRRVASLQHSAPEEGLVDLCGKGPAKLSEWLLGVFGAPFLARAPPADQLSK